MSFVYQALSRSPILSPLQQVSHLYSPRISVVSAQSRIARLLIKFISAIENEFNAFNLQLKARPRKLLLNNISLKNNSFHYNANEIIIHKEAQAGF